MDSVDSVFLDTTIQLYRIAYGPDMKRDIDAVLADKQVYSSSFVFREFLRTIIADLVWVHQQASTKLKPGDDGKVGLDQLSRYIALGENVYSARSIQRTQQKKKNQARFFIQNEFKRRSECIEQ